MARYATRKTIGIIGPVRDQIREMRIFRGTPSNTGDQTYVVLCNECGSVVWNQQAHDAWHNSLNPK